MAASYDDQLPGAANPHGHNFVVGFGLLPNIEISGRLAANTLNASCFVECGIRDLSASGKFGIALDAAQRFTAALGATDIGGAATNFRSYYGVFTYAHDGVEASAGLARAHQVAGSLSRSPLHGPFAAAAWQPVPWLRGHIEYADHNAWAGIRLFAPRSWMPDGWSAYVGSNHRLNNNPYTQRSWFSAGVSIPLYKVPESRPQANVGFVTPPKQITTGSARAGDAPANAPTSAAGAAVAAPLPPKEHIGQPVPLPRVDDAHLQGLAGALQTRGFDSIWVGRTADDTVVVRADNGSYRRNSVDALGAALGAVATAIGDTSVEYTLVLTQHDLPIVAATGKVDCLRLWVGRQDPACIPLQLSTPGTADLDKLQAGAAWLVRNQQPAWQTLRLAISPVVRTRVGTEVGALDYSAAVNLGFQMPLWTGGWLEWRRNVPLANTSDFDVEGVFGPQRVRSETERFALVQLTRLPLERWIGSANEKSARRSALGALTFQGTIGRVGTTFNGVDGAVRWEPGEGLHRLIAEAGYFRNPRYRHPDSPAPSVRVANPLLMHYRYSYTPTRSYLEASAGQFMYNDRGFQLGLRQWFNDVSVRTYYRRSRLNTEPVRQFVGLELSFPIGPRHDARPLPHLQVGGTPRFSLGVETLVRDVNNAVRPGYGVLSPGPSPDETFNLDRAGLAYFESNLRRIRDAAQ